MKITLTSVFVDDQGKALAFYTEKLGFVKDKDTPIGPVTIAMLDDSCGNWIQLHQAG